MNELTRTASKRTLLEAIAFLWFGYRGKKRKFRRSPLSPLKHPFLRYTTEVDCGCEPLKTWPMALFKHQLPDYKQSGKHADIKP